MRVLLVEDDPNLLALWGAELRNRGLITCTATNFVEARESLIADPPDMVIADLCVDRTSWREFVLWLQQSCPDVRRIIVAGAVLCAENDASTLEEFGVLLRKPVDLEALISACRLEAGGRTDDLRLQKSG